MIVPIESHDIRSVYLLEMSGQRGDRRPKYDPRIEKIRRKLIERLKARQVFIEGSHHETQIPTLTL